MMTHFMLDGSLAGGQVERLNATERELLERFDRMFGDAGAKGSARKLSHAFFAALNGVLISFRNYPGRSRDEVTAHMVGLARAIAVKFGK
jgi:hypothetical protein